MEIVQFGFQPLFHLNHSHIQINKDSLYCKHFVYPA